MKSGFPYLFKRPVSTHTKRDSHSDYRRETVSSFFFFFLRESFVFGGRGRSDRPLFLEWRLTTGSVVIDIQSIEENKIEMDDRPYVWISTCNCHQATIHTHTQSEKGRVKSGRCPAPVIVTSPVTTHLKREKDRIIRPTVDLVYFFPAEEKMRNGPFPSRFSFLELSQVISRFSIGGFLRPFFFYRSVK